MLINSDHLKLVTKKNIHIVRWPNSPEQVETAVREASQTLNYRLAVLRGERLSTEHEVLLELAAELDFPAQEEPNWSSTSDFLGDLGWILLKDSTGDAKVSQAPSGVVVFVRNPGHFLESNTMQFAFLADALGCQSQHLLKRNIPFQVVIGPMPEDYRYECFMNILSVSPHFCDACQMVDDDLCWSKADQLLPGRS